MAHEFPPNSQHVRMRVPEYTIPTVAEIVYTLSMVCASISGELAFFSVAMTTPFRALTFSVCKSEVHEGSDSQPARTLQPDRRQALVDGIERVLDLAELARWAERRQRERIAVAHFSFECGKR